jgi:hypothetical protein
MLTTSTIPIPSTVPQGSFSGVSCTSPTFCLAVGAGPDSTDTSRRGCFG